MEKFFKDLAIGQMYEKWFSEIFLGISNPKLNNDNKFDLKDKFGNTFEVKTDTMTSVYYNASFEISSWGKVSGIAATKADYWVAIYPILNVVMIIPTKALRAFMEEYDMAGSISETGDEKSSKMKCWSIPDFKFWIEQYEGVIIERVKVPFYYPEAAKEYIIQKMKGYLNSKTVYWRERNQAGVSEYFDALRIKIEKETLFN